MPRGGRRAGAGRPATGAKQVASFTLSDEAQAKLAEIAQQQGTSKSAVLELAILGRKPMKLIVKNERLFAVDQEGKFVGQIVNEASGRCRPNPDNDDPATFARTFSGHGSIYHQHDNPPNPFFVKSWGEVFKNPELLPVGTKHVFVDQDVHSKDNFDAQS